MIMDGKVIVLTRDAANHTQLSAFSTEEGSPAWTSAINDSLSFNLIYAEGKIYSRSHKNLYCYNAANGLLNWQTDLLQPSFKNAYTYLEDYKLIMVKQKSNEYTTVTLSTVTGSILKTTQLTVPTQLVSVPNAHQSVNYANNTLYVTAMHNFDTLSIKAYDLSSSTMKWDRRFTGDYLITFNPVLTDKYLIFPISAEMYFIDLNGKDVTRIPFDGNYTNGILYEEKGVLYKAEHIYSNR